MASDPQTILAEKLRTLEARVAMAEDDIAILRRQQGWTSLTSSEKQALLAFTLILVVFLTTRRARVQAL